MNKRDVTDDCMNPIDGQDPEYAEDGVDLTLIRWMLSLTPTQRLRVLENHVAAILRLRGGRAS